ncbi:MULTISPECIES: hypothetical protein [unclassified Bartonella]|uniref:hypothetical protein n=1 Tax=unclassified Bartonella TaxID=2645622 RepID=UPI0023620D4E|nr:MULTISPECIES: hypothetical protein [unclassified Bartonella]
MRNPMAFYITALRYLKLRFLSVHKQTASYLLSVFHPSINRYSLTFSLLYNSLQQAIDGGKGHDCDLA